MPRVTTAWWWRSIHSEEALRALCVGEIEHCFDLSEEPLYRLRLLRTHFDGQWALLVTLHHIVADGWSLGVLFKELAQLYPGGGRPGRRGWSRWPFSTRTMRTGNGAIARVCSSFQRALLGEAITDLPVRSRFPLIFERPTEQSIQVPTVGMRLPAQLIEQVRGRRRSARRCS